RTENTKAKISEQLRNKPKSVKHKESLRFAKPRPILQFTLDNIFIKEHFNLAHASKEYGFSVPGLSNKLNTGKSFYGYIWWEKDRYNIPEYNETFYSKEYLLTLSDIELEKVVEDIILLLRNRNIPFLYHQSTET